MNRQTQRYHFFGGVVLGVMSILPLVSYGSNIGQVTVKVTIVSQPCTINNDQPIEVDFGEVMTTRVDGQNYRMPVNYTLNCPSLQKNALRMQISGNAIDVGATTNVLETNIPDFGIVLARGSTPFNINSSLDFIFPALPELYAAPIKKAGVTLPTGAFTASSTMKVTYQ